MKMITQAKRFVCNVEPAEGDVPPDAWATTVVKIGCILILGIVILQGIVIGANITSSSPFYNMYSAVIDNTKSGYTLSALMVLAVGAAAILHFLGFV